MTPTPDDVAADALADGPLHEVDHLIIGGGMAASAAATALNDHVPERSVAILCGEPDAPYERPPLSKDAWDAGAVDHDLLHDVDAFGDAILRVGRTVVRLDPHAHVATDDRGHRWRWRRSALLATGATPKRPPFAEREHPRVSTFRSLSDLRRLRAALAHPSRVTVVGAGLLGCELAWTLRHAPPGSAGRRRRTARDAAEHAPDDARRSGTAGHAVTLAYPDRWPLAGLLPAPLGRRLALRFQRAGIELRPHVLIQRQTPVGDDPDGPIVLHGDGGESWTSDRVIACVGVAPNDVLARDAGLTVAAEGGGVLVDDRLRTSVPHLLAVGDVAVPDQPGLGPLRSEHEDFAKSGGLHAGHVMAGADAPYDHLPYFWCDLAGVGFEGVGRCDANLPTRLHGPAAHEGAGLDAPGVVTYHRAEGGDGADADGALMGVLTWNLFGRIEQASDLLRAYADRPLDPDAVTPLLSDRP
ncbi:MAG: FAD-dependent oxidoreductase [Trueperaceae bacterium]